MIRDVVAATGFVALVAVGLSCVRRPPGRPAAPSPPRRVQLFVSLGLSLSLLSGLSRRELWPFATWALMYLRQPAEVRLHALVCADSAGTPFAIDHRAWAPLTEEELLAWIDTRYPRLRVAEQDSARGTLLRMAESSRQRVRRGGHAASSPSLLGRWAASSHMMHPRLWNEAADAPATACSALRLVERSWNVRDVAAGRGAITEQTIWEYRSAP